LFLSAGSVLHATGTRDIDQLGGLAKKMPSTALAFLVGAIAICGLPPLNGFVSELLLYLGLFRSALLVSPRVWVAGALGTPALALIGALAVACFVKVFGGVFLGSERSDFARRGTECGVSMTAPMVILGTLCAFIGLAPSVIAPILDHAARAWAPDLTGLASVTSLAPLGWLSITGAGLLALLIVGGGWLARLARVVPAVTWDCGYADPSSRMQYTTSSFADSVVRLFSWALRPDFHLPQLATLFPASASFSSHVPDTILDRGVLPVSRRMGRIFLWFRWVQRGNVHLYLLYVLATLLFTLLCRR
jgi:hydrogenase-4 component B